MYNEGVLTSLKNAVIPNTTHPKKSIRHIIVPEISPPQLCCDSAYKKKQGYQQHNFRCIYADFNFHNSPPLLRFDHSML